MTSTALQQSAPEVDAPLVPSATGPRCTTLGQALLNAHAAHAAKPAVVWGDRTLTYADLLRRSRAVAAGLKAAGLQRGDRCALWLPNTGEFVELYFGMALCGVIAVPVNFRFTAREAEHVLSDSQPAAIVVAHQYLDTFRAVPEPARESCALQLHVGASDASSGLSYEEWLTTGHDGETQPVPPLDEDAPFFIGYTSGTTGLPKGAVVRQRPMLDNVQIMQDQYGRLGDQDRFLTLMPMFHSNSTWFAVACVAAGATNVVMDSGRLTGDRVLDAVDRHGVTVTSVVPTILQMVLDARADRPASSGQSLRALLCGSAPLTATVKQRVISELEAELWEGYGATETGVVTALDPGEQLDKLTSVGRVVQGKQVEIRDDQGVAVAAGEVGELWCRGRGVLLDHYWRNDEATRRAQDGAGWYTVGDLARQDEDGCVYLVDRKNDMIISGGENVYPTEVEEVLLRHGAVREVAVVGVPDERWGERVHAVVALKEGAAATPADILGATHGYLARYKIPRDLEIWDELPKTATGKVQRRKVKDAVIDKQPEPDTTPTGDTA